MNAFTPMPRADDITALPPGASPETEMMQAMERLAEAGRRSTAEMLSELRRAFPDSPLAQRVRALEALRRR